MSVNVSLSMFPQVELTNVAFWTDRIMVPVTFAYFADCLCHHVQAEEEARRNRLMRDMAQLRLQVSIITLVTDCSVLILSPVNLYEDTPCDLQSHLPFL